MVKYTDLDSESNLSAEADYIHSKDDYIKFLDTLYSVEGIDLSLYKQNQLRRRLNHIVRKTPCKTYVEYLTQIRKDEEEYRSFIDRITINVSNFFRNAEKFDILERDYLKPLIKTRREATLWSAGCSTGDEPYTLAIMLEENNAPSGFKVLGWDFDKNALAKAREGIYPAERLKESPRESLRSTLTSCRTEITRSSSLSVTASALSSTTCWRTAFRPTWTSSCAAMW